MGLGEQILAGYAQDRKMIEVSKWIGEDGKPLVIYFSPLKVREMDKLQRKHKNILEGNNMSAIVDALIMKCEDIDGKPLFTLLDKPAMLDFDLEDVANVFAQMMNATVSIDDAEKN